MKRLLIICVTGLALMLGGLIPAENADARPWGWGGYYRPGVSVYAGPRYGYRSYYRPYAWRPYYRYYGYPNYYSYPRYSRGFYYYGPYAGVYVR
ncbi:MAG TPA: hypothetical protein VFV87_02775 [Pirellulaceae bacterium]|nr:hypothetical protein [Pirellulaceae bacterium]